jgi:integrase
MTSTGPTLAEWIADRWASEHGQTLERSTRARYADAYRIHIAPERGDRPLRDLTVGPLRAWQAGRVAAGVSPGTVGKCRTFLSGVLRHTAESEAIPANPMSLVRPPKPERRDAVRPLAPATVEKIRRVLAAPKPSRVPERTRGGVRVAEYAVPDERSVAGRTQDAAMVSLLAYSGLRPGELRAPRWGDVRDVTLTVERAADDDGAIKATKTGGRRPVRLLAPLAHDLRELRIAQGRPTDDVLFVNRDGAARTKTDWQVWRAKH